MKSKNKYLDIIKELTLLISLFIPLSLLAFDSGKSKQVHFTDKNGLPRNIVSCFVQDHFGYGWVGTGNGIARFDGYSFVRYDVFEGQFINSILVDRHNRLWVGSDAGLYSYSRENDNFQLLVGGYIKQLTEFKDSLYFLIANRLVKMDNQGDTVSYENPGINTYAVCNDGTWIARSNDGLVLNGQETKFLEKRNVSLVKKLNDELWVFCRNGDIFRLKDRILQKADIDNHQNITDIEKIGNEYWIATDGNGILIVDEDLNLVRHLLRNQGENLLTSNSIYDIYNGIDHSVWISTYGAGLSLLSTEKRAFHNILPDPANLNSLVDKEGTTVLTDNNRYFLGTNYGFSVFDLQKSKFQGIPGNELKQMVSGSKVTAFSTDGDNIWLGTYDGLLAKFSKELKLLKTYHPCSEGNEMQQIIRLFRVNDNYLLIGTHYRNKSLLLFNTATGEATPVELGYRTQNKFNYQVNSIRRNRSGEIVVMIRNLGIFVFNQSQNNLENIYSDLNSRITFRLNDFYQDREGNYWFATQTDGLLKLSTDGRIFEKWTTANGFPTNSLLTIESINDSILWISSISGLCSFDMKSKHVQIYNIRHGLASNEFLPRSSNVIENNKLIFGHSEGFTIIDPQKEVIDTSKTRVVISDISFHNQSIKKLGDEIALNEPLEKIEKIILPYSRNSFTIRFFTLNNELPKFNIFSYRLKGLESNWIYLGENNQTTYTNLSPGDYEFQVKCTNKSNVWNDIPTTLKIRIRSPWYLSWVAIAIYIILGFAFTGFGLMIYRNRIHLKKELEISEFKAQKEHELTENKLAFYTNISHDLKTPLTLISAPVNDLLKSDNLEKEQIKKLEVIKRNASHLYKLISDLVDFRKITLNQLPLRVIPANLHPVIENIYESFINECHKRDIDFTYNLNFNEQVYFDIEKIEKILWNLLANAVKFTPEGGKIWVKANLISLAEGMFTEIEVGDTGKGIADEEKARIFDRFYQVQQTTNVNIGGSGIGLSIVHDLVELHHGTINVQSEPGKGSIFTIKIPAEEKFYNSIEKSVRQDVLAETNTAGEKPAFELSPPVHFNSNVRKYNLPKMIIVEDNEEFREYLASHFNTRFKVFAAPDGIEGLKLIVETDPDIIITDAMMPGMNGYELSRKVRENFGTSHIPVVMLTANSAIEQKIEGLSSGVDSYVTKPIEIEFLDATVSTLLQNRKKLKEKFLGVEKIEDSNNSIPETDLQFLNNLKDFILGNISDENLNIDTLVKHFSISRTQLNRKIRALTNYTPNNYIKHLRLKKAYELLKLKKLRVNEVAFETGFTDPNYFTMCFRKEFGDSPSKVGEA